MRFIGYVRVSTDEQATEGVSLAAQAERIRQYAGAMGYDLAEVVEDAGYSGKSLKRPGIASLLERCRRGEVAGLIVYKLDRLTRSVRDLLSVVDDFARQGVAFVSVQERLDTSTAGGRFVLTLFGALAELERGLISERTRDALTHKRDRGEVYGPVPLGYRRDGDRLNADESEQRAVTLIRSLRQSGAPMRRIAAELTTQGIPTKRGGAWASATVKRVLDRLDRAPVTRAA